MTLNKIQSLKKNLNLNENNVIVEHLRHQISKNKKSLAEASKANQQTK